MTQKNGSTPSTYGPEPLTMWPSSNKQCAGKADSAHEHRCCRPDHDDHAALLAERDQLQRELERVESGLYEDMRDELVAENARLVAERDHAAKWAEEEGERAGELAGQLLDVEAERDQLAERVAYLEVELSQLEGEQS